jgi:hypothetical protein
MLEIKPANHNKKPGGNSKFSGGVAAKNTINQIK